MFTIQAHGIKSEIGTTLSYAQNQLIQSQSPIRICGAPTGTGKTYVFLELAKSQLVFFVVPTQAFMIALFMVMSKWHSMINPCLKWLKNLPPL